MNNEDDDVLRPNRAQAMRMSRRLGCSGAHEFEDSWMPCESHEELTRILDQINSLDEKDDECLPCSQGKSAQVRKRKRRGKKPVEPDGWEDLGQGGVAGIDTLADGSLVSASFQKSLTQWFKERWVDISRPKKGGGFEPCGRDDADKGKYPKCVPASRARSMTPEEIRDAVTRKRRAESTETRVDKKPIYVPTKKKDDESFFEEKAAIPTNPELYARVKEEAKRKFDVYPSAYANAWLVREYKKRGGKYRSGKADDGEYEDFVENLTEMQLSDFIDWMEQNEKAESKCPPATQDIAINLRNRKKAIDSASYGPLNPNEKNTAYWAKLAGEWDVDIPTAKKQRCGNCALFIVTDKMKDCIEQGVTGGERKDEWDAIDAVGELGYCEAFDFKCAAKRTCRAWVTGGPITEEKPVEEKAERRIRKTDPDVFASPDSARVRSRQLGCIGIRRYRTDDNGEAWMPCTNESDYRLRMGSSPLARRRDAERDKNFVRRVALAASKLNRKKSALPASEASTIDLDQATMRLLSDKVKLHNDRMQKSGNPDWSRASLRALKAVYYRGSGASSRAYKSGMSGNQWALGRVNAFLQILSNGKPSNLGYVTDNDLLPEGHPWKKREKTLVQRVTMPGAIDNLKAYGDYWSDASKAFDQTLLETKAAKRRAGAKLRTIGQEVAKRGGALVDEDGMLRCPPTSLNGGQFTNWKLDGCNDPSGAVRVIAQRVTDDALAAIPENRRITNAQAAQIARQGVATSRLTEGARSSIRYRKDIFRKINPRTRNADRLEAIKKFDTASRKALSSRLGDRDLSSVTTDELDQILALTNKAGQSVWSERQTEKLLKLRQEIDDLESDIRSIQIMGTGLDETYAIPRNVSVTFDADDIFDENDALSLDGEEGVFRWLSDNIDEITSVKSGSIGTVINAVYDDATGTVTFDIADVYDKSEQSLDSVTNIARARGAASVLDMDRLADRDMEGAFIDTGVEKADSTYAPSQPTTDVRVRRPRTTDPTGQVSRLAGQDKVGGRNYTPGQKAAMVNAMIEGVPGLLHIKPVPILRAGSEDYSPAQLKQIDDAVMQINDYIKENMMRLLAQYDSPEDKEFRARAKHWYPVANQYIGSIAAETDIHPSLVAAAMAAISPQLSWDSNVVLGEHMAKMIADPDFEVSDEVAKAMAEGIIKARASGGGTKWKQMVKSSETAKTELQNRLNKLRSRRNRGSRASQKRREGTIAALEYQLKSLENDMKFLQSVGDLDAEQMTEQFKGRRIQDMSNFEVAIAHRAHASVNGMKYIDGSEGPLMELDLNPDPVTGKANPIRRNKKATGAYLVNDIKAIQMLRDGDRLAAIAGDVDSPEHAAFMSAMISSLLGNESKVRSFYNNLNNPMDSYFKDITNDTWMAVAGFAMPAKAATTKRNGKPFNETKVLFDSLESLGHGRGYGLVSAAIMNVAEEWKQLTGEDFTQYPRAMQSVLWELARREWLPGNKTEALAASRELADAISSGRSEFSLDDRHEMLGYIRTATYGKAEFGNRGGGIVEFLKARGVDTDISKMSKMSVQDRIQLILSVMKDSRGRPLFKGPIPIAEEA